jgi:glyoxylase-like metal-dependent hydrolase (beta-lactamase superfamily II)
VSNSNKQPQIIFDHLWAFSPNRQTLGGTAYLIVENHGNILVDCPAWTLEHEKFLSQVGGVRWLVLTHRGGMAEVKTLQQQLGCQVIVQEQEAYLLPDCPTTKFATELILTPQVSVFWTPGHSPGSACVFNTAQAGILCSGRHLLPTAQSHLTPLRTAKTFHWPRQLKSVQQILDAFSPQTLSYVCPGANTGFLRGERAIAHPYEQLAQLDLIALRHAAP